MKRSFLALAIFVLAFPAYASATTIYLTSGSSWTVPSDWNNNVNSIETIGGGGAGRGIKNTPAPGGGGGAYSKISNMTLTPGASVNYTVGAQGVMNGSHGGDTYFNGASCEASSVCARGGKSGGLINSWEAGVGGQASESIGTLKNSGGNGGDSYANNRGGGGGGAGGPDAAGIIGVVAPFAAGGGANGGSNGGAYPGSHAGGYGGGLFGTSTPFGSYYGGGGGGNSGGYGPTGNTAPGIIVITYTPFVETTCSVIATDNPLDYDDTTTLQWSSSGADTFYINNVGYVTPNSSGSATVGPLESTSYSGTAVGPGGTGTCEYELEVEPPPVSCSLSVLPTSIVDGESAELSWSSSGATSCTGDNFSTGSDTSGSMSVAPSSSITYTASCTNAGGTSDCTPASLTVTPSCTPVTSYTCSGTQTIVTTSTSSICAVSTMNTTCIAPQFCSAGQSVCLNPNPSFEATSGTNLTGHLQAVPRIIKPGDSATLYWDVENVLSCTVSGNGATKSGVSSGSSGSSTPALYQQATYTLRCLTLPDGSDFFTETQTINLIPGFREL